jgi:NitT/TauT family transport system substrate-binding protein
MRSKNRLLRLAGSLLACALFLAPAARAAEQLAVGGVGGANAVVWMWYIAMDKGFFEAEGLDPDLLYSQSNALVLQALTAGSTKIAIASGLADIIHAQAAGASLAVVRIEGQVGPYGLLAKPEIKSIKDLKGKTISVDEARGTTKVYFDLMLNANGVSPTSVDYVYAGATAARYAALKSGAADAAMLTMPFNFRAESDGYVNLGYVSDYNRELPFTGAFVAKAWATSNRATLGKFLTAYNKTVPWFYDAKNRAEAIDIMVKASRQNPVDIGKSYDLFVKMQYFDKSNDVSQAKLNNFIQAMRKVGDPGAGIEASDLMLP